MGGSQADTSEGTGWGHTQSWRGSLELILQAAEVLRLGQNVPHRHLPIFHLFLGVHSSVAAPPLRLYEHLPDVWTSPSMATFQTIPQIRVTKLFL